MNGNVCALSRTQYKERVNIKTGNLPCFFLVMSMLGHSYVLPFAPFLTFGEISLAVSVLLLLRSKDIYKSFFGSKLLCAIWVFAIIIALTVGLIAENIAEPLKRILRDGFYWFIVLFVGKNINVKVFMKYVRRFCIALASFILLQVFIYQLTGFLIPGLFPSGMVDNEASGQMIYDHILFWVGHAGYLKPNGFLSEASHCAQCLFIGTAFELKNLSKKDRCVKSFGLILLFSIANVLTFSASAVIFAGMSILFMVYFLIKYKRYRLAIVSVFICILGGLFLIFKYDISKVLDRIISATSSNTTDGSIYVRIYKGFIIWAELPVFYKIFGIGVGNYSTINLIYSISPDTNEFLSSLSYFLVSVGIIGMIMIAVLIVKTFRRLNGNGKIYLFILLVMCLAASVYSTPYWIWLLVAIINNKKVVRNIKQVRHNG